MKVSKEERAKRFTCMENLLAGLVPTEQAILQFCATQSVGQRTARKYVALVRHAWAKESAADREAKRLEIERAADHAYRQAIILGELSPAVQALKLKAQLHGLANRVEITGANGKPLVEDAFAERLLKALEGSDSAASTTGSITEAQASTSAITSAGPSETTR